MIPADTGAVYALLDRSDAWHHRVVEYWEHHGARIRLLEPTLPEICYLVNRHLGAWAESAFVQAVVQGDLPVEAFAADEDLPRIADLLERYHDAEIGFVDAAIVAAAERLDATTILTTDRRHFPVIRPSHRPSFLLAP